MREEGDRASDWASGKAGRKEGMCWGGEDEEAAKDGLSLGRLRVGKEARVEFGGAAASEIMKRAIDDGAMRREVRASSRSDALAEERPAASAAGCPAAPTSRRKRSRISASASSACQRDSVKPACWHTCAATALAALLQYRVSSIPQCVQLFTGPWCLGFGGLKYVEGLKGRFFRGKPPALYTGVPKRKSQEGDKRSRDRQKKLQQKKKPRST